MLLTYRLITLLRSPKRPLSLQVSRDFGELDEGDLVAEKVAATTPNVSQVVDELKVKGKK